MNNWLIVAGNPTRASRWGNESGLIFRVANSSADLFTATKGTNVVLLSGWQKITAPHELRQIWEDRINSGNPVKILIQLDERDISAVVKREVFFRDARGHYASTINVREADKIAPG